MHAFDNFMTIAADHLTQQGVINHRDDPNTDFDNISTRTSV